MGNVPTTIYNPLHKFVKGIFLSIYMTLTTTQSYSCHVCNSINIVKAGKERKGNQKYKCKDCKTSRVLILKPVYSPERRIEIMNAYIRLPHI
jgi:transposase-like protein